MSDRVESSSARSTGESPPTNQAGEHLAETFRERLDQFFEAEAVKRGRTVTNTEVAEWMTHNGYAVQRAYISSLRTGRRKEPSWRIIEGLAAYFEVEPSGFLADPDKAAPVREARLAKALEDRGVEAFALRAEGLSEESLKLIIAMADRMRAAENLDDVRQSAG